MKRALFFLAFLVIWTGLISNVKDSFDLAKRMFDDGLYEEAVREFRRVIEESPTSQEAEESLFLVGEAFRARKQYDQAEDSYRRLLEGYPNSQIRNQALYHLALVHYEQGEYARAADYFSDLIRLYPMFELTRISFLPYIESTYETGDDELVIYRVQELMRNYPDNEQAPGLMLFMSRARIRDGNREEGLKILDRIIEKYPQHPVRWETVDLKIDLLAREKGYTAAVAELERQLTDDIPRLSEEKLRFRLANMLIKLKRFDRAAQELEKLVQIYDRSEQLDQYLMRLQSCRLELKKYTQIIDDWQKYSNVIQDSPFRVQLTLITSRARYLRGDYSDAGILLKGLQEEEIPDSLQSRVSMLEAEILEAEGRFTAAIRVYRQLTASLSGDSNESAIQMRIGRIYLDRLQMAAQAVPFFERAVTTASTLDERARATYQLSICREMLGNISTTADELYRIDTTGLTDTGLAESIQNRREYLRRYRVTDVDNALAAMIEVLSAPDSLEDRLRLIRILADDLKEYDKALALLDSVSTTQEIEIAVRIHLALHEKARYETRSEKAGRHLALAGNLLERLDTKDDATRQALQIRMEISAVSDSIGSDILSTMEDFIARYPESPETGKFRLVLADHYQKNGNQEARFRHLEALQPETGIAQTEFQSAKLTLAESYFKNQNYKDALRNYELLGDIINLTRPELYYHWALCLSKTGQTAQALERLTFLINNQEHFSGFKSAIETVTATHLAGGRHREALKYLIMIPPEERTDVHWQRLADIRLGLDQQEEAKIALLHIKEKDSESLFKLGQLQTETGDLDAAEYTFSELLGSDPGNAERTNAWLGHTRFLMEDYAECVKALGPLLLSLGENPRPENHPGLDIKRTAREAITAYYRLGNRPRAESIEDQFESIIENDPLMKQELLLEKARYYIKTDPSEAEDILDDLIEDTETAKRMKEKARFWRGAALIKREKPKEAAEDFQAALQSGDPVIRNRANFELGTLHYSLGEFAKSLQYYYDVIQNDSTGTLALDAAYNFAIVCKRIEEWEKAINAYEIILERWGDRDIASETRFNIAYCYYRDKKYPQAVQMFEQAMPLLENRDLQAEAQFWIGESYFGSGEYDRAINAYLKVGYNFRDITRWAATAELKAGEAYIRQNRTDKARFIWERVIENYGAGSQWGKLAQERLDSLKKR